MDDWTMSGCLSRRTDGRTDGRITIIKHNVYLPQIGTILVERTSISLRLDNTVDRQYTQTCAFTIIIVVPKKKKNSHNFYKLLSVSPTKSKPIMSLSY